MIVLEYPKVRTDLGQSLVQVLKVACMHIVIISAKDV